LSARVISLTRPTCLVLALVFFGLLVVERLLVPFI
jgi:hypothetical protein